MITSFCLGAHAMHPFPNRHARAMPSPVMSPLLLCSRDSRPASSSSQHPAAMRMPDSRSGDSHSSQDTPRCAAALSGPMHEGQSASSVLSCTAALPLASTLRNVQSASGCQGRPGPPAAGAQPLSGDKKLCRSSEGHRARSGAGLSAIAEASRLLKQHSARSMASSVGSDDLGLRRKHSGSTEADVGRVAEAQLLPAQSDMHERREARCAPSSGHRSGSLGVAAQQR